MKRKTILILGSTGLVGQTVFTYLQNLYPNTVSGTTRSKPVKNQYYLSIDSYKKDFKKIKDQVKDIDYIINCIGLTDESAPIDSLIYTNSLFPHLLENIADEYNSKLIHISTDAVFQPLSGNVNESNDVSPINLYGSSKFSGETKTRNALTIRTSLLGFDSYHHKGLLESILRAKKTFPGFINQKWSGCTTLQFVQLCHNIIAKDRFTLLRKQSNIYHFAPLTVNSKYKLVQEFNTVADLKLTITKSQGPKQTRVLSTNFFDILGMVEYTRDIHKALQELCDFNNTQTK